MVTRITLFIQALATFILGLYLTSLGLPSNEVSIIEYTGNEIMNALDDVSDNPEVHKVVENTKSSLAIVGVVVTIGSSLELIALGISLFIQNGHRRI